MYAAYLPFSGYRVAEATNGVEAIEKTVELMPDIILMDLALPRMDGWEATRRLKLDERTRHIPIVALTGPRAGRPCGRRAAGRLRLVRHQAVPAGRAASRRSSACCRPRPRPGRQRRRSRPRPRQAGLTRQTLTDGEDDTQKKAKTRPKAKRAAAPPRASAARPPPRARGRLDASACPPPAVKAPRAEPAPAEDSNEGKYVYCIIKTRDAAGFGPLGIGAEPVRYPHRQLSATSPRSSRTRRWSCRIRRATTCSRTSASTRP